MSTQRPSFEMICMGIARQLAMRSTCSRLQVGCVITSTDFRKIISWGYNGGASGLENECTSLEPGQCGHLHSEVNAAINCEVSRATPKLVFLTHLPCVQCAKVLVNLGGVARVYYEADYRIRDSLDLLKRAGIEVERLSKQSALVLAIDEDGHVLSVTNRRHGGFGLPGGKVDAGETPTSAAVREFREETGVDLNDRDLIPITRSTWGDGRIVHIFLARAMRGVARTVEEGTVPSWMDFDLLVSKSPFAAFYREVFPAGIEHLHRTIIART